jgi:hypothetical protein
VIGAIGFTLIKQGNAEQHGRAAKALAAALAHFPGLEQQSIGIGATTLVLWGRAGLEGCTHTLVDGSLLALIGTPIGKTTWAEVENVLTNSQTRENFRLPWDGRVILLRISPDGNDWTIWNDWLGSIPIFYSNFSRWRIASTLEPVVVGVAQLSSEDIFLPGLLLLLSHGNYLADWTLFKNMYTVPPDSVTRFTEYGYQAATCHTVEATDARWERGWEELLEEMHALVTKAIGQTLQTQAKWIVPLSGGLDSRLIAAVGAEMGVDMHTYTWGPPDTMDGACGRQIARALHLPWQRIDLGVDYLARCLPLWVDLFGSSMHFHGMYQIPFLETLRLSQPAPIVSGFIGECLAGYDVHFQAEHHGSGVRPYTAHPSGYTFWEVDEMGDLFCISIDHALKETADLIDGMKNLSAGPWFQKLRFLTIWGRQNHFTYFQSLLSDYYRGVATPYVNREYARFCLSLPRAALDERRLQIDMMRRYYARVMTIGGTYDRDPAVVTGRYLLKRRLAGLLPSNLMPLLLPAIARVKKGKTDVNSLHACGEEALWPIPGTRTLLSEWVHLEPVDQAYTDALAGDMLSVRKLQALQAFAYRLQKPF